LMVAVTFGAAAGFPAWPDDEAGADDCDVLVLFDEQPPATSAVTMSGYVRKATCFIAYLLPGWHPARNQSTAIPRRERWAECEALTMVEDTQSRDPSSREVLEKKYNAEYDGGGRTRGG
jgi:hypothetical protein